MRVAVNTSRRMAAWHLFAVLSNAAAARPYNRQFAADLSAAAVARRRLIPVVGGRWRWRRREDAGPFRRPRSYDHESSQTETMESNNGIVSPEGTGVFPAPPAPPTADDGN